MDFVNQSVHSSFSSLFLVEMVRSSCFITLSEEWKNNRQVNMKEVELGARDLQLVDDIFQQLVFDRCP